MAATFLKAKSYEVGLSLVEETRLDFAVKLMDATARNGATLLLPGDVIVAREQSATARPKTVSIQDIPSKWRIVDIGPQTIKNFKAELGKCRTVFWNGPMGVFEIPRFAAGTQAMARALAGLKATTVIGGGSTAEIVTEMGLAGRMTFVSTGGGASLRFLGGRPLPGVEVLLDKGSL